MATVVQLQVTLDANGAVTGLKQLGSGFDDLSSKAPAIGKKGVDAFNGIESAERKAHVAGQLWVRLTGTEMPRALENVIARSKTAGPLLASLFNASVVAAVGVAVVGVVGNIVSMAKELGGATAEMQRLKEETIAANLATITHPQTLATAITNRAIQLDVVAAMQKQADEWRDSNLLARAYAHTLAFLGDEESQQMVDSEKRFNQNNKALEDLSTNTVALTRSVRAARLEAQAQIDEAGKKGFALIKQQHADEDRMAQASFDKVSGLSDALPKKLAANAAKAKAASAELTRSMTQETVDLAAQTAEMQLKGDALIEMSISNRITKEREAFMQKTGMNAAQLDNDAQFQYRESLIIQQGEHQRVEMHRQTMERIKNLESEAAVASLPEWQRGAAQIIAEEQKTTRELQQELATRMINKEEFDRLMVASTVLANAKMRDENKRLTEELGSDLQSVFDDITSGNIGKRILSNMEKLFFQILAQWILSLNMMKSAAGSIFGSIVFGPGSTGAGVFGGGGSGGGSSSLLGGVLGGLFGGSSSEGAKVGFGGAPGSSSMAIPGLVGGTTSGLSGAIAGIGASPSSALVPSASSALTSSTMADALPGLVGGTTSQIGSSSTRTSSFAAGSPLVGLAALAPALVGNFGGKLGQIGGLVSMLAIMGNSQILSALSGGLIGFGVGQSHGGFLGALAGAGSGALTGFLAAGPIGAIIGGLVGLLGGIFGGIFGGSKRKKQANALADNTILPDIAQIITGFDGFQVDSSSAIQQLEQLRNDAQKQLSALKSQGKDVFNQKVAPAIDNAEKHIRDTQAERDRRSAIAFGPPQFDTGGTFNVMRGNAGLAILHDGEFVVNPTASKKNAAALNAMNQGKTMGGGNVTFIVKALDSRDVATWLKNGGAENIARGLNRLSIEGKW
jgi:hypothetical protein